MKNLKFLILLVVMLTTGLITKAQNDIRFPDNHFWYSVSIGKGDATVTNPNAWLEIGKYGTNKGLILPRANVFNIAAAEGNFAYDINTKSLWFHNGTVWTELLTGSEQYDSAYLNAKYFPTTGILRLYRVDGDSTSLNIAQTLSLGGTSLSISGGNSVSLSTTNVAEGSNLYFTTNRVRQSFTINNGLTFNNSTGLVQFGGSLLQNTNLDLGSFTFNIVSGANPIFKTANDGTITLGSYGTRNDGGFEDKVLFVDANGVLKYGVTSFLTAEVDPIFTASPAGSITNTHISNWNTAYNDKINSLAFSGTGTKTLTLTQQDGGTLTGTFTDLQGVTSVGLSAPSVFTVTGSPVTSTGTLALSFATGQTANQVLATPNGTTGALGLRALVAADIPNLDASKITTGIFPPARLGSGSPSTVNYLRGDGTWATPNNIYNSDGTFSSGTSRLFNINGGNLTLQHASKIEMFANGGGFSTGYGTASLILSTTTSPEGTRTYGALYSDPAGSGFSVRPQFRVGKDYPYNGATFRALAAMSASYGSDFQLSIDSSATVYLPKTKYANNASGDSVLTTDINGQLKQVKLSTVEDDPIFSASPAAGITSGNITNWNAAYNDKVNSIAFTNGTLTLTQQDGGTLTANTFNTTNIPEGSNLYFTNARARLAVSLSNGLTYDNTSGVGKLGGLLTEATNINTTTFPFTMINTGGGGQATFTLNSGEATFTTQAPSNGRIGYVISRNDGSVFLRSNNNGGSGEDVNITMNGTGINLFGSLIVSNNATAGAFTLLTRNNTSGRVETTGGINASFINAGTIATARLGSGTANSTTALFGDQTYKTVVTTEVDPTAIKNQTTEQTANFNISGNGTIAGITTTPFVYSPNGSTLVLWGQNDHIEFIAGTSSTKMTLDTDGRLGIGKLPNSVRASYLEVAGNIWSEDAYILGASGNNAPTAEFGLQGTNDAFVRTMSAGGDLDFLVNASTLVARVNGTTNNFEVANRIKISGGTPGAGKVLMDADGTGLAQWATIGGGTGTVTSVGLTSSDITVGGTSPITTAGTFTLTLPNINSNVGTFNNLTVNAKGQVTAASNVAYLTSYTETDPIVSARTLTFSNGTGISVTGGTQSLGANRTWTITNTAPDQTVTMANGTGISVTGTYPNFTITNTSPNTNQSLDQVLTVGKTSAQTMTVGAITAPSINSGASAAFNLGANNVNTISINSGGNVTTLNGKLGVGVLPDAAFVSNAGSIGSAPIARFESQRAAFGNALEVSTSTGTIDLDARAWNTGASDWSSAATLRINGNGGLVTISNNLTVEPSGVNMDGPVGINTASPSEALHVVGNIYASGTVTAAGGGFNSLRTLKKDITDFTGDALTLIDNLKLYNFKYKSNDKDDFIGMIIDEKNEVPKELLMKDGTAINTYNTISLLIKSIQQLNERLERLEKSNLK